MDYGIDTSRVFQPLAIAILIVSDTRTEKNDTSGNLLQERIITAGHKFVERRIVTDDIIKIRKAVRDYINAPEIDVIITSGGTGLTHRDVTPEAIAPLFEKTIDGFASVFHQVSLQTVGLSTLQSRALAGLCKGTLIFCLPGSNGGVRDGWDKIISLQLDSRYRPCNFSSLFKQAYKDA